MGKQSCAAAEKPKLCGDTPHPVTGAIPKSKRTGKPCRQLCVPGGFRCRFHGGTQQTSPLGSKARGGRPKLHGAYARRLPPKMLEAAEELFDEVGKLEHEVTLSRAILADLLDKLQADPAGGVVVSKSESGKRVRPYAELVAEAVDRVARAELARGKMIAMEHERGADDIPIGEIEFTWTAGANKLGIIEGDEDLTGEPDGEP